MSTSTAFILYYLPLRARCESIRMILRYGGVSYEDVTIPMTEWPVLKANRCIAPFGQLPSIKLSNGEIIAQSGAIVRLAAKLAKIYPNDPIEASRADMIFEFAQELNMINPLLNFWPTETDTWHDNYRSYFENLPRHLETLSTLLADRAFFGGSTPNHGDFAIFHILDACLTMRPECLHGFPSLVGFVQRVSSIPSIQQYLQERPPAKEVGLCGSFIQTKIANVHHHH